MANMSGFTSRVSFLFLLLYSVAANGLDVCEDKSTNCQQCNLQYPVPSPNRENCMKTCQVCTTSDDKNIALKKPTDQSTTSHDIGTSKNAVDNNTNGSFINGSCTHTKKDGTQWWCVDLKMMYNIWNIRIYNRAHLGERLMGFELKTSSIGQCNEAGFTTSSLCYKNDPPTNQRVYTIDRCNQDSNKSIVAGSLFVSVTGVPLTICEFQVFTGISCSYGYYSTSSSTCEPCDGCSDNKCNPDTGDCIGVCKSGFYGTKCQQKCSEGCENKECTKSYGNCSCINGWYGPRCQMKCNTGCKDNICDQDGGRCSQGCKRGKQGDQCNKDCSKGCFSSVCRQNDGNCSEGCNQGLYGDQCNKDCSQGCSTPECERDGSCTVCIPGWYGDNCESRCPTGCKETCNKTNGACDECKEGSVGLYCDVTCGVDCPMVCKEDTCERTCSRKCNSSLCPHGIQKCRYECKSNKRTDICFKADDLLKSNSKGTLKIIIPLLVIVLVFISAVIFVVIFVKKRKRMSMEEFFRYVRNIVNTRAVADEPSPASPVFQARSDSLALVQSHEQPSSNDYENVAEPYVYQNVNADLQSPTRVAVKDLNTYTKKRKSGNSFKEEFQDLPNGLCYAADYGMSAANKPKNRYKGLSAYDHSRVTLDIENDDPNSDYINACYITGFQNAEQKYIASQGPFDNMVLDFWRMIWFVEATKIVMLTNLREMGVQKCLQYWPNKGQKKQFGKITLTLVDENVFSFFTTRKLEISKEGWDPRYIVQFHYTAWPDKSIPRDIPSLLEFTHKVNQTPSSLTGPIVVHCSAGIGRTGTFIGLDYLLEEGKTMESVDVFKCVEQMRYERVKMVQTMKQYVFIHEALSVAFVADDVISVKNGEHISSLINDDENTIIKLFKKLESVRAPSTNERFKAALLEENKYKNRDMSVLPLDEFRFFLPYGAESSSDYINAVYLPSFRKRNGYIITQTPLHDTVNDFWKMLIEAEVEIIVDMENLESQDDVGDYLPGNGQLDVGDFMVTEIDKITDSSASYSVLTLNIQQKNSSGTSRKIKFYQCRFWKQGTKTPKKVGPMLTLIDAVHSTSYSSGSPVVVMCLNGAERSGLFCVLSEVIERLKTGSSVDILLLILQLKLYRPQMIPFPEQLSYCIDADIECADRYNLTYANYC